MTGLKSLLMSLWHSAQIAWRGATIDSTTRPGEREAAMALADGRFRAVGAASIADVPARVSLFA